MTFEDFWTRYPRRVAKRAAERAFNRLSAEEQAAAIDALPAHVRHWRLLDKGVEFIPHPATWLNQGRWEDELPEVTRERPKHNGVVAGLTGGGGNVVDMDVRRIG